MRRLWVLDLWRDAKDVGREEGRREPEVTAALVQFLASLGLKVSRGTLYNGDRARRYNGAHGLADQRARHAKAKDHGPFLAELRRLYVGPGLLSAEVCYTLAMDAATEQGWDVPTLREAKRYLKAEVLPDLTRERGSD
jgi:hypothetical protein